MLFYIIENAIRLCLLLVFYLECLVLLANKKPEGSIIADSVSLENNCLHKHIAVVKF